MPSPRYHANLRQRIATEAARIIVQQGYVDIPGARRKAARQLKITDPRLLPDDREIESALREYQNLFQGDDHPALVRQLREEALQAMLQLREFQPRLFGPVAEGTAQRHSRVQLLLTSDNAEAVIFALMKLNIPWQDGERPTLFADGRREALPQLRFRAGDTPFELTLITPAQKRRKPLTAGGRRALAGIGEAEVEILLNETAPTP